jgi:hypothetical protein
MNYQNERCKAVIKWHGKSGKFRVVEVVAYSETMNTLIMEINMEMVRIKKLEW